MADLIGKVFSLAGGEMSEGEREKPQDTALLLLDRQHKGNPIYGISHSWPLKSNCFFFPFKNRNLISCTHPVPKVAISKQQEVVGSEQFRCNLFPRLSLYVCITASL